MSLINDALKRATSSKKKTGGEGEPPLSPTDQFRSGGFNDLIPVIVILVVIVGGTYGAWLWWKRKSTPPPQTTVVRHKTNVVANAKTSSTSTNNNPIARAKSTFEKVQAQHKESEQIADNITTGPSLKPLITQSAPPPPASQTISQRVNALSQNHGAGQPSMTQVPSPVVPPAVSSTAAPMPSKPVEIAAATSGDLDLQAIFFRPKNPAALISGKSVHEGDFVNGARVVAIERQSVILVINGVSKTIAFH